MKLYLLTAFALIGFVTLAQAEKKTGVRCGQATRTPIEGKYLGFRIPVSDDMELLPQLINVASPNDSENEEEKRKEKAAKWELKMKFLANWSNQEEEVQEKKTRGLTPVVSNGFNALSNTGTPSDNTVAVNKNNVMVAMVNSNIRTYNTTTNAGISATMNTDNFFTSLPNSSNTCDPKVIYDPQSDRFIAFAQTCDGSSSTSDILLAFSKTNDPAAGWHFYSFSGNPDGINADVWFDYPKIGISNHDVFISGNFFDDNFSYVESGIYQIDKTKCYAGGALVNGDALFWSGMDGTPFTMVPMSYGQNGGYGNNMYLVSTDKTFSGSFLNVYEITNAVQSNPQLTAQFLSVESISTPSNAPQQGTSVQLETGDFRGMDGFFLNNMIHFVHHCDVGSGFTGINYFRLVKAGNTWGVAKTGQIKASGKDFAFPAICSFGYGPNDQGALISFNYVSNTERPGIKCVYYDHNFTPSSQVEVKTGTGSVTQFSQGGVTRWGDYSGLSRVQNASTPTAWCFGMFGNSSSTWTNFAAKIATGDFPVAVNTIDEKESDIKIYPNPVREDLFKVEVNFPEAGKIEIDLLDLQGRVVRSIYNGHSGQGKKLFLFNKAPLTAGTYIVRIQNNSKTIYNEKITVTE
jgi:hypothetical protein